VVKFQLPQLGQVNATIRLQGDHVQLQVNVQNPETAASLKAATDKLALALAASGTELDNMTVQNDATIGT
jgi:flagellar hook-length control protein FliK